MHVCSARFHCGSVKNTELMTERDWLRKSNLLGSPRPMYFCVFSLFSLTARTSTILRGICDIPGGLSREFMGFTADQFNRTFIDRNFQDVTGVNKLQSSFFVQFLISFIPVHSLRSSLEGDVLTKLWRGSQGTFLSL